MELFLTMALAFVASLILFVCPAMSESRSLIIEGEDAELGELPYQLSLQIRGRHQCGAVLIEPGLAVTAAHCIRGSNASSFQLHGGIINTSAADGQMRQVKEIIIHPDYNVETIENDICLLTVTQNFDISSTVNTILIAPEHFPTSGNLQVSGWGRTGENKPLPMMLQKVVIPFISDQQCQELHSGAEFLKPIRDANLCAGFPDGRKGFCKGDSGGPLVSLETNYLVGIVSWRKKCDKSNYPSVFTEVAYFTNWINEQKKLHL